MLTALDVAIVVAWLALSLGAGLWFARQAAAGTDQFFVTDRKLPWWAVGTSMVATTFAADTPLAVSGYVAAGGIAANWRWWYTGVGAMASVFFFARLWRRSGVVTDAELTELRYGGRASQALRAVKAVWFGVFLNVLVIAWVMRAMQKIAVVVLAIPEGATFLYLDAGVAVVLALFVLTVIYTTASGLFGVIATDVVQFGLAMFGAVVLAVMSWQLAGGLTGMQVAFDRHGFDWAQTTALLPRFDTDPVGQTSEVIVLLGVLWWTSRTVDSGGYLAQRLFSARDERHALWGALWFTVANLCLRPWPWVIVGLAGMAVIGPVADPETYYPRMMALVLPAGLFGLMVASFLAAFMSTVDTQLHWGASLLVNDLYRRFIAPNASDAHHLAVSRGAIIALALAGAAVSFVLDDIRFAWELAISVTAGLGTVYVARWLWWRPSAWSEISAMVAAGTLSGVFALLRAAHPTNNGDAAWLESVPLGLLKFPFEALWIALISAPIWLLVTALTAPPNRAHLRVFYLRVRPGGPGWRAIASDIPGFDDDGPGWPALIGFIAGTIGMYAVLLGTGALLLGRSSETAIYGALALVAVPIAAWAVARESARPIVPDCPESSNPAAALPSEQPPG